MKKLNLKQIQKYELEILMVFDRFCKENNLQYSLAAGTLIGAARHNGFIPWDDDIDVFMLRKEYDKLYEFLQDKGFLLEDKYQIITYENENGFLPFLKLTDIHTLAYEKRVKSEYTTGIWVDIFPLDYCGHTLQEAKKICEKNRKIIKKYYRYYSHYRGKNIKALIKNIYVYIINKFVPLKKDRLRNELLSVKNEKPSEFIGPVIWASDLRDAYPAEYFQEYDKLLFQGLEFPVFKQYDKILRWRYGDYMIPKQYNEIEHVVEAYDLSKEN